MNKDAQSRLVGLMADQTPDLLVGLLAIMKSGNGFVPINPDYPASRIGYMISDCEIDVLVTERKWEEKVLEISRTNPRLKRIFYLDDLPESTPRRLDGPETVDPDETLYVIYTSGSTGNPKGVPITHHNLLPLLQWSKQCFGLGEHTRALQNLSYCFDFGIFELLTTIFFGGTLYFCDRLGMSRSSGYADLIREHSINTVHSTPSIFQDAMCGYGKLDSLKVLHFGGEQLTKAAVNAMLDSIGDECVIYNGYGPTEVSINNTIYSVAPAERVARLDDRVSAAIPIGRPTANDSLYVLDKNLKPVPVGVPGELHIGGRGQSQGYINLPELTAERFIPNPFSGEPGARLYKTGDLVRFLEAGDIEFLGRLDDQVKVRGFRIELGEVESALSSHPAVREAVALARENRQGNKVLVGYVTTDQDHLNLSQLRSHLKERLPAHMIPSVFVILNSFPLTSNGKLDRKALPAPDVDQAELKGAAARTMIEEVLIGIWSDVIGLKQPGVHDNFFAIGGHSLLATQLVSRVRSAFEIELPLREIFTHPTIAELAARVEAARAQGSTLQAPPITAASRSTLLPLAFAQQRLWFFQRLAPESAFYNMADAIGLDGSLNVAALERTFDEIFERHEILRTTFPMIGDQPVQRISEHLSFSLPLIDLTGLADHQKESETGRLADRAAQEPFDLAESRLLKVALVRLAERSHVLLVTMHHIISDGWSMQVLFKEIVTLYGSFADGKESPLERLPFQYVDFAQWQRQWLQGEVLQEQLAYWRKQLGGRAIPSSLDLPYDHPRPAIQSFEGAQQYFTLSPTTTEALKSLSRQSGVTLFMTLLAAFKTLLYRYTGREDIVIGSPIANRRWTEIEALIGFFVNILVLRTNLSGNPTFKELLHRVRQTSLDAYVHQDLPFEKIVEDLHPERDLSGHTPLFQVSFALQNTADDSREVPGLTLKMLRPDTFTAKFDLWLSMHEADQGLSATLEYNTDLFEAATISRMIEHFKNLVEGIVAQPDCPLSSLPLVSSEQRQQLIKSNKNTKSETPRRRRAG